MKEQGLIRTLLFSFVGQVPTFFLCSDHQADSAGLQDLS